MATIDIFIIANDYEIDFPNALVPSTGEIWVPIFNDCCVNTKLNLDKGNLWLLRHDDDLTNVRMSLFTPVPRLRSGQTTLRTGTKTNDKGHPVCWRYCL
jgi:hypothetical protein